jgi:hypothetical protein
MICKPSVSVFQRAAEKQKNNRIVARFYKRVTRDAGLAICVN